MTRRRSTLLRVLVRVAIAAFVYATVIVFTGGFLFDLGPIRISSRNPVNPVMLAALALAAAFLLVPSGRRLQTVATEIQASTRALLPEAARRRWHAAVAAAGRVTGALPGSPGVPAVVAFAVAAGVAALGVTAGALVVSAADTYGYVSYGRLWGAGTLRVEPPWMRELVPVVGADALAPLGYRASPDGMSLAPTYSPGLPMVMGLLERLSGRSEAVFLAAPLLAALGIWATYLLGRHLGGPSMGLAAAVLLAVHPLFVHYLIHPPMSDFPAMAWWTLALALVASGSRTAALGAGAATGMAILTRPNLLPLALVPGFLLARWVVRARRIGSIEAQRMLLFAAGCVPACLAVAWLNHHWFGSALSSGYGSLEQYFSADHLPVNLAAYPAWLLRTTPLLGIVAALVLVIRPAMPVEDGHRRDLVVGCAAFAAMNFACYAFYLTFEGWWALRFLAPSLPPLLVLTCVGLAAAGPRLPGRMRPLTALLLAAAIVYSVNYVKVHSWGGQHGEYRYARAGQYVAEHVPERAVLFAMLHSGTARYYTGRPTVRWDFIEAGALDDALDQISERGYHPYLLLDVWEEDEFRARFAGASRVGRLDWDPVVVTPDGVRIYDTLPSGSSR